MNIRTRTRSGYLRLARPAATIAHVYERSMVIVLRCCIFYSIWRILLSRLSHMKYQVIMSGWALGRVSLDRRPPYIVLPFSFTVRFPTTRTSYYYMLSHTAEISVITGFIGFHPKQTYLEGGNYCADRSES